MFLNSCAALWSHTTRERRISSSLKLYGSRHHLELADHPADKVLHNAFHLHKIPKCICPHVYGEDKRERSRDRAALGAFAVKLFLSLRQRAYMRRFVCWCDHLHKVGRLRDVLFFTSPDKTSISSFANGIVLAILHLWALHLGLTSNCCGTEIYHCVTLIPEAIPTPNPIRPHLCRSRWKTLTTP